MLFILTMTKLLLRVENLKKYFPAKGGLFYTEKGTLTKGSVIHAVDDVSFTLYENETLGIVGESGCGKSTLASTIVLLNKPTSGKIYFYDMEITKLSSEELRKIRPMMQIIFQDPYSSLNPRMRIKDIVAEPLSLIEKNKNSVIKKVKDIIEKVGLREEHLDRYPHELSAGQRQRVAIARALITNPKLVILDEPTSALDVSTQAQILNLLKDLQKEYKMSYIFISHNISVVSYMSDRMAVMYLGKIVEIGRTEDIIMRPKHPYTKILMGSIPLPDPKRRDYMVEIIGETPSPVNIPTGCRFHPRCPYAKEICKLKEPNLREIEDRLVSCHLAEEIGN
ncbi:Oligopeptide transport ATP-binding protein OppF [archaeon HR06]|nr:Oligopeptide transport ATP-binding protein OppF [archaeon HR06]